MSQKLVSLDQEQHIGVLSLCHPPKNELTSELLECFQEQWQQCFNSKVHAIVITGSARCFSTGIDPQTLSQSTPEQITAHVQKVHSLFNQIAACPIPVLAAIEGACLGGGLEFALACHLRYASHKSSFSLPEVSLGIFPAFGGIHRLPHVIGTSMATEWILSGQLVSAKQAQDVGLIQQTFGAGTVFKETLKKANAFAKNDIDALKANLSLLKPSMVLEEATIQSDIQQLLNLRS